jgi:hypothetical protein
VSNQAVFQLLAFWQSDPMYPRIRGSAARDTLSILEKEKRGEDISDVETAYIDDMLDFFETAAFLTNSGVLGHEATYQFFSNPWQIIGCSIGHIFAPNGNVILSCGSNIPS